MNSVKVFTEEKTAVVVEVVRIKNEVDSNVFMSPNLSSEFLKGAIRDD